MASNYTKQTWTDNVHTTSGARMTVMEDGIHDAHYPPAVSVTRSAVQSISNNTVTAVAFTTESGGYDQAWGVSSTHHDNSTNNSRLTVLVAGIYWVTGVVRFAANATGRRELSLVKGGATTLDFAQVNGDGTISWPLRVGRLLNLAVNDYLELQVFQNSGGALDLSQTAYTPWFEMVRVG